MKSFELIYVIEDDPITSKITELHLIQHEAFGQVKRFRNGQPAFDALLRATAQQAQLPDLILLDLNMPVMDGWEFLDALKALPWQPWVCVLTSSIHPGDMEKATSYPVVKGYFTKPVSPELLSRVAELPG